MLDEKDIVEIVEKDFLDYLKRQPTGVMGDKRPAGYFDVYVQGDSFSEFNTHFKGRMPVFLGKTIEKLLDEKRIEFMYSAYFLNPTK